ncbi:hypothetical protein L915_21984, partial [Phytophthora nicotianae]
MLKGKTPEEAEEVLHKLTDDILPLLENVERKGITPQNLGNHPTFKKLSNEEATHLKQYFDLYWKTFKGNMSERLVQTPERRMRA